MEFMEQIEQEVRAAEPPRFADQGKPKGRKKKSDKAGDEREKSAKSKDAKAVNQPGRPSKSKSKMGKKNYKKRRQSKKAQRSQAAAEHWEGTWDDTWEDNAWESWEDIWDDEQWCPTSSGPSASSRAPKAKSAKGKARAAKPKAAAKRKATAKCKAAAKRKAAAPKSRAKRAKKGDEVVLPNAVEPVEPIDDDEPGPALPPYVAGLAKPPTWVKAGNVYSNSYRRLKSAGLDLEEVRNRAREVTGLFRTTGKVPEELLTSFNRGDRWVRAHAGHPVAPPPNRNRFYVNNDPNMAPLIEEAME